MDILKHHLGARICNISINFHPDTNPVVLKHIQTRDGRRLPFFEDTKDISGVVWISIARGHVIDVNGIKAEFVGEIVLSRAKRVKHQLIYQSQSLLEGNHQVSLAREFNIKFSDETTACESFSGHDVCVRFFVRITMETTFLNNIVEEFDIWVHRPREREPPWVHDVARIDNSWLFAEEKSMAIGKKDLIYVKCCMEKYRFALGEEPCIPITVETMYSEVKVKQMRACLIRRETAFIAGVPKKTDVELLSFPLGDGDRILGSEARRHLLGLEGCEHLTPTYDFMENKFSIQYFVELTVTAKDGASWKGEHEVLFWRPLFWMNALSSGMYGVNLVP